MLSLLFFLFKVIIVSLSGVMAPGPVTAAAVAKGQRQRFAGALIAVGHGIIEFPLMILIILGMDELLKSSKTQIVIGLTGGAFLLFMAIQMLRDIGKTDYDPEKSYKSGPVLTGFLLSVGNPYFLLWWASVGLALATEATQLGIWAFAMFAIIHWLCDLVWFQVLSWASFKGSALLGPQTQRIVLLVCSLALLFFGLYFISRALAHWLT